MKNQSMKKNEFILIPSSPTFVGFFVCVMVWVDWGIERIIIKRK